MSQLRIMRDGKPDWLPEEPARARVSGYGGSLIHHAVTVTKPITVKKYLPRSPFAERRKERPVCGVPLSSNQNARLNGEPCARTPGHTEAHRSKAALERAANGRRTNRPHGGFRDVA